ncbi:MAG: type II toxin-antitoxin system VapC family toxin [Sulfurisoma sp.]|nr:type II toxin-antitoxin system VapC family toxin [Sulfurisoma sp.]
MILLDTQVWVRWLEPDNGPLPRRLTEQIESGVRLAVSAVSCWEIAYLERRGRIELPLPIDEWLHAALDESGVECLPITLPIAVTAARLTDIHRDPADRFIIATALQLQAKLISLDGKFKDYPELGSLLVSA